jgi:hypothetical protein
MRRLTSILIAAGAALFLAGCNPSPSRWSVPNEPSADRSYAYRVTNDDCNCLEYTTTDKSGRVEYRFGASYKMQQGVLTDITVSLINRTSDTLFFERAAVRVSSRNVHYQYNNKFLPIPWDPILPRSSAIHKITGKEVTNASDWNKIAGELLSITIKGLRLADRELPAQTIDFQPENPKIGQ